MKVMNVIINEKVFQDRLNESGLSVKKLNRFISLIFIKYLYSTEESVEIPSTQFRSIDNKYKLYLNYLIDENIIYINKFYEIGKQSRKYGFTDKFKERTYVLRIQLTNEDKKKTSYSGNVVSTDIKNKLKHDYRKLKIVIKPELRYKGKYSLWKKWLRDYIQMETFKENNLYRWKNNRLYTSFNMCSSYTRKESFFLHDKKLSTIDIKSSFPTFLSLFLNRLNTTDEYSGTSHEIKQFTYNVMDGDFYEGLRQSYNSNMHLFYKEKDNVTDEDITDYYEYIDGKTIKLEHYSRDLIKKIFMIIINTKMTTKDNEPKKIKTLYSFYMKYPIIFDIIQDVNTGDKNRLYYILEEMESEFLYNTLIKRLYEDIPSIHIVSCHDQIYFDYKYEDEVNEIYEDELNKLFAGYYKRTYEDTSSVENELGIENNNYYLINQEIERLKQERIKKQKTFNLDSYLDNML